MAEIDVGDLVQQGFDNLRTGIQGAIGQLGSVLTGSNSAEKTAEQAAKTQEQGSVLSATADAIASSKRQLDNAQSAALIGNLPGAASRVLSTYGERVLDKQDDIVKRQDELEKMKGTSPFQDPFQWLVNSFTTPFKEARLNQEQADLAQRIGVVKAVQTATSDAERDNATADVADATTKLQAATMTANATALKEMSDAQLKAAQFGLSSINIRMATTTDMFSATLGLANAQENISRLDLERFNSDVNATRRDIEEQSLKLNMQMKSDNDAEKKDFESKLVPAAASVGLDIKTAYQFDKATTQQKGILQAIMATQSVAGGDPFLRPIGLTPGEALTRLDGLGTLGPSPGMAKVVQQLNQYKLDATNDPMYNQGKPETRLALEDTAIKSRVQAEAGNISPTGGIYSPSPLSSVLNIPLISQLPLAKDLAPLAKNTQQPTNPDDILAMSASRIAAHKGTPESEAAQVAAIFQAAATDNNSNRQYSRLAISSIPINKFPMTVATTFGGKQILNLANPVEVRTFLQRKIIQDSQSSYIKSMPGTNIPGPVDVLKKGVQLLEGN